MLISRHRAATCAIIGIAMLSAGASVDVESQSIDVEQSTLTVHVYKAGVFSAFADNHVVRAPIAGGRISENGTLAVELTVKAAQMTVLDPALSTDKRAEVQARMHGPEVLDSARYPDIRFTSTHIAPDGADRWQVIGDLTLHGTSRPLTLAVELTVKAAQMTVLDPALSANKRADVQARMHGPEVLDSARYPDIRFTSTHVVPDGADRWQVIGDLTLHSASRSLTFVVVRRDGRFRGTVSIRQRDFGIRPISIVGGTVKVRDEVQIDFDIVDRMR